jgi:mycothiol synthase
VSCGSPRRRHRLARLPPEGAPFVTGPHFRLAWRPLGESDLTAAVKLAAACLAADGGQPFAADAAFVRRRYLDGARARTSLDGDELVCISSVRPSSPGAPGHVDGVSWVTTGLVHPRWRRRGIGGGALDWAHGLAVGGLRAETEALSDGAHALYLSRGLAQVFAEDVMQLPATAPVPPACPPAALKVAAWGPADPARFFATYEAAFRDRPGFPGRSQNQWIEWISDDEDFRAEWTLLATIDGRDVAFIAGMASGWIVQVGVAPHARGRDIGAGLIAEVIGLMRAAGETTVTLNVNIDNPHAIALYDRLGFIRIGQRARYAPSADSGP